MGTDYRTRTIAPLTGVSSFPVPVELAPGIRIVPKPDWITDSLFGSAPPLDGVSQRAIVNSLAVIEIVHEEIGSGSEFNYDAAAQDRLYLASMAIWLSTPNPLGFQYSFVVDHTQDWIWRHLIRLSEWAPLPSVMQNKISNNDLAFAGRLCRSLGKVARPSPVWMAIRALLRALRVSSDWELRYVLVWIALEAVFGPSRGGSSTHIIAERMAIFCKERSHDRTQLYSSVKKLYGYRSQIVHGGAIDPEKLEGAKSIEHLGTIESLVRGALALILESEELTDQFSTPKKKDQYFLDLMFGSSAKS